MPNVTADVPQQPDPPATVAQRADPPAALTAQDGATRGDGAYRVAVVGLFAIGVCCVLYFAASLLIPIAVATLLSLLLSPTVRTLARWRVPPALSAAVIVGGILLVALSTFALLSEPAQNWLQEVPEALHELREKLDRAESPLTDIEAVAREVDDLTAMDDGDSTTNSVEIRSPGLYENLLGELPSLLASLGVVVFLTFFLLASGDSLLRSVTRFGTTFVARRRIVTVAHRIQSDISRYLATVTVINTVLGLCTAGLMHLLGVANPLLWGVLAGTLNFAPYLGGAATTIVLLLVGITTFDTLSAAMLVPASFLFLTVLEGQLVTPAVIGRRLAMSPTAVFLSVVVWGWLWGVAGALIAVPIIASIKVICENIAGLQPVAELLGD